MLQEELNEYATRLEAIKSRFKVRNTDLARIAGVSDNSISKIMSGLTTSPDVKTLARIARKFNLSGDWLFLGEGPMIREEVPDNSLKRGLQLRDELIAQLQKELWGKFEGAIFQPISSDELDYQTAMRNYLQSVFEQPFMQSVFLPYPLANLVAPR
ncbi:helix-turn-helix domain-containing protein [Spirosoma oryzicola]|uniref:helix-turn-helix domain-containing protein n=1 Tax=Spirosoma oryzicola TaxID=2898794 RepID=UPI001E5979F6|nr:helix-turn-helix transcriptional regulator [Spirosoma oryzicola]UHG93359.1 helix-turn-helix domain-containing protein [Spirosoma oryzicola]